MRIRHTSRPTKIGADHPTHPVKFHEACLYPGYYRLLVGGTPSSIYKSVDGWLYWGTVAPDGWQNRSCYNTPNCDRIYTYKYIASLDTPIEELRRLR